jgi:hypothetical protein
MAGSPQQQLPITVGPIIRSLQHLATKLWNVTNFVMLFQAVMKFLSRLVEIKNFVYYASGHLGLSKLTDTQF